jgi:D-glycero-D-manno-heptose 1,7-bisphosphate phosphatase
MIAGERVGVLGETGVRREKALFLDRDGVINEEVGYLHKPEQVRWVEGIFDLCATALRLGYRLVVVTNQSGIARGLYTEEQFDALMAWMREQFAAHGVLLDGIYCCPYHPEHGIGKYKREHEDRKPGAGMLRRAARELNLDLEQSVMVGDRCTDVAAANTAGVRKAFLLPGTESKDCAGEYAIVASLREVGAWLEAAAHEDN